MHSRLGYDLDVDSLGVRPGTMQQSKRMFTLYIWRNQGLVCIVDTATVAIKGVGAVGIEGMGSRVGSANIWGRFTRFIIDHHPPTVLHSPPVYY